jgi:hypothetical protein
VTFLRYWDSFFEEFSVNKEMFSPFACVSLTYPFPAIIPWKEIIVEIPYEIFGSAQKLVSFLESISVQDLQKRRKLMLDIKNMLLYDRLGSTFDAFSATMYQVCKLRGY